MARITEEENERLHRDVSLERLVEARGLNLRRDDDNLVGACPFHDDGEHALVVAPKSNTWTCPECEVTDGTIIEWTMKAEGISRRHATELLRADHGGGGGGKLVKNSTKQKLPDVIAADVDDAKLLEQIVTYYAETLTRTPTAMDFLAKNRITGEAIERFRLGLSDRTLGYRLPKANRRAGAEVRGRLQRLGVLRDTGHESFRGCITAPLLDEHGAVVSVYGRRLDDRVVESPDVYVNSEGLFNIEALKGSREIVVCSSVFDAVIMWSNGVQAVTAVHEGNVDELLSVMVKHGVVRVTFCFPRTDEGQKQTEQLKDRLAGAETEVFRALLPVGMTVQSFTSSSPASSEALASLVRQAEWVRGVRPASPSPAALVNDLPMTATAPTSTTTAISALATTSTTPAPNTGDIFLDLGDRRWRIRGLGNNLSYERLRVHLFVSRETKDARTSGVFVDTIELYSARQRNAFVEQAAEELGLDADIVKRDLGHVLLRLEALQDEQIRAALAPKADAPTMSDAERAAA